MYFRLYLIAEINFRISYKTNTDFNVLLRTQQMKYGLGGKDKVSGQGARILIEFEDSRNLHSLVLVCD